jgi:aarF domain-containing kinase
MLSISGTLFRGFDFGPIVKRTNDVLAAELDFEQEARNSELCRQYLAAEFGDRVTTPTLVKELCTPRVLVTEFIDGVKMNDRKGMEARGISVREAALLCYSGLAHQLFCSGFVHADPHPGNIFVTKNRRGKCQVVILDHGLYVTLSQEQRKDLADLWTAIASHHDRDLEKVCTKLGVHDYKLLASVFIQHPYEYFSSSKTRMDPSDLELVRRHSRDKMDEVNNILEVLPKEYAMVLRNISAVRATNKDLGNPVSRPATMLKYSLRESHRGHLWYQWRCLAEQWWQELKARAISRYIEWRYPGLNEALDDMLTMG